MQDDRKLQPTGINVLLEDGDFADLRQYVLEDFTTFKAFFHGSREPRNHHWPKDRDEARRICLRADLIERQGNLFSPRYRLTQVEKVKVFVSTDFPYQEQEGRVYPWSDEADVLLQRARREYPYEEPQRVLNVCCGGGFLALALARLWPKARIDAVDNNPRACERLIFNSRLNQITNIHVMPGDLFEPVAEQEPYDLIVASPPFALGPEEWPEFSHSAGGGLGDRVLALMIRQARPRLKAGGRFLFLAYSLGTSQSPTILLGHLRSAFPEISWPDSPVSGSGIDRAGPNVWRFGESKCVPCNPMPVEYMVIRFGDPNYMMHKRAEDTEDRVRDNVSEYVRWIEQDLKGHQHTHIHYVVVNLQLPRAQP